MPKIRPFVPEDIPQVVDLHPRAFEDSKHPPPAYFERVFLQNPWADEGICSLVCEDDDGRSVVGFLGAVPRRFLFRRQTVRMAIAVNFMVDPSRRSSMAGLQLFRAFLAGPQDLSMADTVNHTGRRVWEALGSQTVWISTVRWNRALRLPAPSRSLQSRLNKRKALSPFAVAATPLYPVLDRVAEGLSRRRLRPKAPLVSEEEIDAETMAAHAAEFFGRQSLRPDYDLDSLQWLLDRAAAKEKHGKLQQVGVRGQAGKLVGWYVYYLNPGASGQVLQIAAKQGALNDVLDSLFHHAWRGGARSLSGRLEPRLVSGLTSRPCLSCNLVEFAMMAHAKDPELLAAIHRGDAVLTPLEGEWPIGFHGEAFEASSGKS